MTGTASSGSSGKNRLGGRAATRFERRLDPGFSSSKSRQVCTHKCHRGHCVSHVACSISWLHICTSHAPRHCSNCQAPTRSQARPACAPVFVCRRVRVHACLRVSSCACTTRTCTVATACDILFRSRTERCGHTVCEPLVRSASARLCAAQQVAWHSRHPRCTGAGLCTPQR